MPDRITVTVQPNDKAFVKADEVTIYAEIDGLKYTTKANIPENFFASRFDQIMLQMRTAIIDAHGGKVPEGEEY